MIETNPEYKGDIMYESAVRHFRNEYDLALNNPQVRKPAAYTLYKTWRWMDGKEDERITNSEWLEDSDPGQKYGSTWACRVCGQSMHEPYVWNPIQAKMRFCPWCGRRMVKE